MTPEERHETDPRASSDLELTPLQAAELLRRNPPGLLLIDCRTPEEWAVARVPGSVHIPLEDFPARWTELEDAELPLAVICHHGVRSLRAAIFLRAQGIRGVRSVAGGIEAWACTADPSIPRYVRDERGCRPRA